LAHWEAKDQLSGQAKKRDSLSEDKVADKIEEIPSKRASSARRSKESTHDEDVVTVDTDKAKKAKSTKKVVRARAVDSSFKSPSPSKVPSKVRAVCSHIADVL
jgi:hypothetical protein